MFDGFETQKDEQARKRWFASAGTSIIIYVVVGIGILVLVRQTVTSADTEKEVDVSFATSIPDEVEKKLEKKQPEQPKAAAPKKARKPGRAAPPPPTRISSVQPEESEPTDRRSTEEAGATEFGEGGTDATADLGVDTGKAKVEAQAPLPEPPRPRIDRDPELIIEDDPEVTRAERIGGTPPVYPEQAHHRGKEAVVVVQFRITAAGEVKDVKVVAGEEPFASAALEAVQTWRYRPATRDGRPIAVARRVRIPFEIQ